MRKSLQTCFALLSLMIFLQGASAQAGRESNGGNFIGIEFLDSANYAIQDVVKNPDQFPELNGIDLKAILSNTKIVVVDTPLSTDSAHGSTQDCVAVNFHDPDTIEINQTEWTKLTSYIYKRSLALHEILGIANIESTGNYTISNRIVKITAITLGGGDQQYALPHDGKISFDDASYVYSTALSQTGLKNYVGNWGSFLVVYAATPDASSQTPVPEYFTIDGYSTTGAIENASLAITQYSKSAPDYTASQKLKLSLDPRDFETSVHFTYQDGYSNQTLDTGCVVIFNTYDLTFTDAIWVLVCKKSTPDNKVFAYEFYRDFLIRE